MRPDVQASIKPVVTLARYRDILVWDVTFPDARVQVYGPIGRDSTHDDEIPPCDLHVIVNATTAEIIEGFQDCPQRTSYPGPNLPR